jgi:phosphoribosylanthranilate isomerase
VGFDWNLARRVPAGQLIVAGGLNPGNVAQAVQATRPFAVDVASGVESSPGCKDQEATLEFIQNAKSA